MRQGASSKKRSSASSETAPVLVSFDLFCLPICPPLSVVLNDEALRPCLICPMNSQEFDRVLEVNGVRGSSVEMATALGSDNEPLTLTLQRPEERTVAWPAWVAWGRFGEA